MSVSRATMFPTHLDLRQQIVPCHAVVDDDINANLKGSAPLHHPPRWRPTRQMRCSLAFSTAFPISIRKQDPNITKTSTPTNVATIKRTARINAKVTYSDPRHDQWAPENLGFLHIATITGPHGVKGEVKARAIGDFEKLRLGPGVHSTNRYLLLPGRKYPRPCKILAGRRASQPASWILRIDGITAREHVTRLRGSRLFVRDSDRPRLARNEYMVGDLVGSRVSLIIDYSAGQPWYETVRGNVQYLAGFPIGVVDGVITREDLCEASGGGAASAAVAADLLEIALLDAQDITEHDGIVKSVPEQATRVLVPFVNEIVPVVDLKRAVVVLDPPPGLLSIAVVNRKEKQRPPRGLLNPAKD